MFRLLLLALLLAPGSLFAQQSDFPLGWGNRDYTTVISVIGRNMNYPAYNDKVFYQSSAANSPSFTFPDYGTVQYGLGSCVVGNKRMQWWCEYEVDGGTPRSNYTINPEIETGTKTVVVRAKNYRKTSCTGGGETTVQTVCILTVKFERPEWNGLDEIKTVCNSVDKDYNLTDFFTVKEGVTFYLDGTPITILNPKGMPPGFHKLTAQKMYDNGTPDGQYGSKAGVVSFDFEFQVLQGTEITIDPYPATICQDAPAINIKAKPDGGAWEGRGIDAAGNLTPASAAVGRNIFTYKITNAAGCTSTKTAEITINEPPVVTVEDMDVCRGADPFPLTVGQPAGGTYTGRGVVTVMNITNFDPAQALVGENLIRYKYTDPVTGCSSTEEFTINVLDESRFKVGDDMTTCNNSAEINLNQRAGVEPSDGSITWSGTGIINSKYFSPSDAGNGLHTITGTLFIPSTGCTYKKSFVIKVIDGPVVKVAGPITICQNRPAFQIPGGSPVGGVWSGSNISGNTFDPSTALPGDYVATYTYSNNVCEVSASTMITVQAPPSLDLGPNFNVCRNAGPVQLPAASPAGGKWSADGNYLDPATGQVDPLKMALGDNKLTYTYTLDACTATKDLIITVVMPPVADGGPDLRSCTNGDPVTLPGDAAGWSGPGVENGRFLPARAGAGEHQLSFTVVDPATRCSNTDYVYMTVADPPAVDAGPDVVICKSGGDYYIPAGSPVGGVWSGAFVQNGYFQVTSAPLGSYTVTLTYTDPATGCTGLDTKVIQLVAAPVLEVGADITTCQGAAPFAPPLPSVSGGSWAAFAGDFYDVSNNVIVPAKMQLGKNYLIYTIITDAGCSISDTLGITKHPQPVVTGMRDFTSCLNGTAVPLVATPQPGLWEGTGIDNNAGSFFVPQDAGAGEHKLTYTYTDPATGCTTRDTTIAKVNTPPVISMPLDTAVCINSGAIVLKALPAGGIWAGSPGLNGATFTPSIAGIGTHSMSYTVTDPVTRCSNTGTVQYQIKGLPGSIQLTGDTSACEGTTVTLTAAADNVTSFSWFKEGETTAFATGTTIRYEIQKDEKITVQPLPVNTGDCEGPPRIFTVLNYTPRGTVQPENASDTLPFGSLYRATSNLSNALTYRWSFGDGGTSNQVAGNHYFYTSGLHSPVLQVTGSEGCTASFPLPPVYILPESGNPPPPDFDRGDGQDPGGDGLLVYPTTFRDRLTLEFLTKDAQDVIITFVDFGGNTVNEVKQSAAKGSNRIRLDTGKMQGAGVWYFIRVRCRDFDKTLKVFKL